MRGGLEESLAARTSAELGADAAQRDFIKAVQRRYHGELLWQETVWNSNLQPDFNVSVCDIFDAISLAVLRELDESNRFVQKSAESTSI